jgi:shikimate dehydrogenase
LLAYGLIGYPLGHSFSAPFFADKFRREGLDSVYNNYPLRDIGEFASLVKEHPDLKGLNVTVPHKQAVIPFLDELDQVAGAIGAVNTISIIRQGNGIHMRGSNTDVPGFERSLLEHLRNLQSKALVLGTGGSSKAVVFVLEKLGIDFLQVSRTRKAGILAYGDLSGDEIEQRLLIINTTPLGMHPKVDECPDIPYEAIGRDHLLFDLVYNPARTLFLQRGEGQGASVVNGYDMLVYQAEASWEIWNSHP